ncbi:hypothetical protein BDB01DRAFT_198737 [Pilobolus umbonatus]|nr:hypothetical protein BDB01DRAFT_198737 [Pilobolus umbonatus]
MWFLLFITGCLFTCSYGYSDHILLDKRQAVASRNCAAQNNSVGICTPSSESVYYNNTYQEITWKYNNPLLNLYPRIDVHLLQLNEGVYTSIKNWSRLETVSGILVPLVDDTWYPTPLPDNTPNVTWTMYMYIIGADLSIDSDIYRIPQGLNQFPTPQRFTLIQNARNTIQENSSIIPPLPTQSTSNIPTEQADDEDHHDLPGWAIAVIVIISILFILAIAGLFFVIRKHKNKKQSNENNSKLLLEDNAPNSKLYVDSDIAEKPPNNESPSTPMAVSANNRTQSVDNNRTEVSSIHSSTPMVPPQPPWPIRSKVPRYDEISLMTTDRQHPPYQPQQQQLGANNEAHHSSSILSSTDAILIADTFRQFMRKPEWKEENESNSNKTEEDDSRKKLGDELLQKQLKKEGTQVQSVDKLN